MTDPITSASIATLIFTTAVGKLTEALTEDARNQLSNQLKALKQLIDDRFKGKAKSALARAEQGNNQAIAKVSSYLDVAMDDDDDFAQQVRALALDIQQIISLDQSRGQNIQNVFGGQGSQVNSPSGTTIEGSGNTIHIASWPESPSAGLSQSTLRNLGVPRQFPPLPEHFVDRPEYEHALKQELLHESTQVGTLVVSAIYGLGGIGKSVLASKLALDREIQMRFCDGTLWATLGQTPDILPLLSGWIQALGDYDYKPTAVESASNHLRTLLYDKRVLLVVDDVWNPEHLEPFRVGSEGCCVLVTTREARIPDAHRFDLDMMTQKQSLELITQKLSQPLSEDEREQALTFAKRVGYLPLALELAASQIEEGVTFTELVEDFQGEVANLESLDLYSREEIPDDAKRSRYSLIACSNLSLRQLSPDTLRQFAWLGVVSEDVNLTQEMTAILWQVTSRQARAILRSLTSKGLLRFGKSSQQRKTYILHDLMHDLAQRLLVSPSNPNNNDLPGLGLTLAEAHVALLDRYQTTTQDGLWHTLVDDGYIHNFLTWHMQRAKRHDAVCELLFEETENGENGWYKALEALNLEAVFVRDFLLAWHKVTSQKTKNNSVNEAQKISLARLLPLFFGTSEKKQESSNAIAAKVNFQGLAISSYIEFIVAIQLINDETERNELFATLTQYIPDAFLPEILREVYQLSNDLKRVEILKHLTLRLPELLPELLESIFSLQVEGNKSYALAQCISTLPENLFSEELSLKILNVVDTIQEKTNQKLIIDSLPERLKIRAAENNQPILEYRVIIPSVTEPINIGDELEIPILLVDRHNSEYSDGYTFSLSYQETPGNDLNIILDAPDFLAETDDCTSLPLDIISKPSVGNIEKTANFRLTATKSGRFEIAVALFVGEIFKETLKIPVEVNLLPSDEFAGNLNSNRFRNPIRPDMVLQSRMIEGFGNSDSSLAFQIQHSIIVSDFNRNEWLQSSTNSKDWINHSQLVLKTTLEQLSANQSKISFLQLATLGQYIFKQVLPSDLRSQLQALLRLPRNRSLLVFSDYDSWIPWEILHDGQCFLAEKLTVGKWPWTLEKDCHYEFPVGSINLSYFSDVNTPEQWQNLLEVPGVPEVRLMDGGVLSDTGLMESLLSLHMVQNGYIDSSFHDAPVTLSEPVEQDVEQQILPMKLDLRRARPLVSFGYISNQSTELTGLESFAIPFIRAGASAFVGLNWAVQPEIEARFISTFYTHLWKGNSLGQAFYTARHHARIAYPDSIDWLAYSLFGDPMARPYKPVKGNGYAVVEPIGQDIKDPLATGDSLRFRLSLRRTPPIWHEERVIEVAEDLIFEDLQVHVATFGLEVTPPTVTMSRTPNGNYLGWFTLTAPDTMAGESSLVQVYFSDGMSPIHSVTFSLQIAPAEVNA